MIRAERRRTVQSEPSGEHRYGSLHCPLSLWELCSKQHSKISQDVSLTRPLPQYNYGPVGSISKGPFNEEISFSSISISVRVVSHP